MTSSSSGKKHTLIIRMSIINCQQNKIKNEVVKRSEFHIKSVINSDMMLCDARFQRLNGILQSIYVTDSTKIFSSLSSKSKILTFN